MALFHVKSKHTCRKAIASVLLSAAVVLLLAVMADRVRISNETEQTAILENAVERSITECYALDGAYPPNIDYLVEHYGLTYDSTQYFIDYRYIGSNLRPDVTIIKRK